MSFTSAFRPSEAQIVISVSMHLEIVGQPIGGAEALCRGLLEVAIPTSIRRSLYKLAWAQVRVLMQRRCFGHVIFQDRKELNHYAILE